MQITFLFGQALQVLQGSALADCLQGMRRDFLRHTGVLPKAYIERFKMHRAAELLHDGGSIAEVAGMLGYRDIYHFSRRFKVRFGVPPGRFRSGDAPQ